MPIAAILGTVAGGLIHGSTLNANLAAIGDAYQSLANGTSQQPVATLDLLVNRAGLGQPGTIAPQAQSKDAAKKALTDLIRAGIISGPDPLPPGTPNIRDQFKFVSKTVGGVQPTNAPTNLSNALPSVSGQPTWVTVAVLGVVGWAVFKLLRKGA